jgi:hypothetical protein
MKFARRLTQKRWVQKTIGVAAAGVDDQPLHYGAGGSSSTL